MATEIINSRLTETYYFDANDTVIVKQSGSVITDEWLGITNREESDIGVSLHVMGHVSADGASIGFVSDPGTGLGTGARTDVSIGDTGYVSGQLGLLIYQAFGADVRVAGRIDGSYGGIQTGSPDTTIRVSGEVNGFRSGIQISSQGTDPDGLCSVFNSGSITSDVGAAIEVWDAGGVVRNVSIISGAVGVWSLGNQSLTIRNEGTIFSGLDNAIELYDSEELATINNSGVIDAKGNAVHLVQVDARLINSGTLTGDRGIWIDADGDLVLRNSGIVAGNTEAMFDHGWGQRDVVNKGLIAGDIEASQSEGAYQLINHGTIAGDIRFGSDGDYYKLTQSGIMTGEVDGGSGDDTLIGNDGADRLAGNAGRDWLRGRDGDDTLNGGSGEDRLHGGAGNDIIDGGIDNAPDGGVAGHTDRLTGGEGADIFVFGEKSGRDRVVDFEDGTDILRLDGHAGGFDALTISDRNGNLLVHHDNGSIVLVGQAGLMLTQADFEFG
ncbi:calcium-binding protein [Sedimentitalea todarodis]|uniref:Calcium-binding protein n=1 Tax=Sedimentitalea todarodis TaxID=1631240 RepID=A0ABU3VB64_9RHOB|nr:calcium-binding protein [Sedimentitalea todarodis]MDU9003417.1 calcium-binding protein [Sedimentitalea todarodis]